MLPTSLQECTAFLDIRCEKTTKKALCVLKDRNRRIDQPMHSETLYSCSSSPEVMCLLRTPTTQSCLGVSLVQSRIASYRKEPSMRAFEGATFIGIEYTINIDLLSSRC